MISHRSLFAVLFLFVAIAAIAACRRADPARPDADAAPAPATASADSAAPAPAVIVDRWSELGMLAEATRYIEDADFRRATLVECLANPKNSYSQQRLDAYALKTKGWDLLPEWNPRSIPATVAMANDLRAHRVLTLDDATPPLWDGKRPTTMPAWIALGREVFFRYPLRVEVFMNFALTHPEIGERVGVRAGPDGTYPGVVLFSDLEGKSALGITCAICHSNVRQQDKDKDKGNSLITGEARRSFDYGALRLAYHAKTKVFVDPELARRMKTWGPGRADVTEDDDEDPVSIPDLWGLRHQTFLTQAGTIKHIGPTALAIRQETQLLHSNHQKIRPPRELAFALAMFLYSLSPPPPPPPATPTAASEEVMARGKEIFGKHCKGCHSNEALGGPPVPAERIGTDRAFAMGGARGTGFYRPPALIRVASAAPYFHHGVVPTLEDVLSPERLEASYTRNPFGKGAVVGHTYGTELPKDAKTALLAYLRAL